MLLAFVLVAFLVGIVLQALVVPLLRERLGLVLLQRFFLPDVLLFLQEVLIAVKGLHIDKAQPLLSHIL